jgi:hypothetical protein
MTTGLLGMMAEQKTAAAMDKKKGTDKPKCGKCPKGHQTEFDENSTYCYCPVCKAMYSPAATH